MNLSEILVCFNAPIKEEQAWAVCHLCGKFLQDKGTKEKPLPEGPKSILFDKDGGITVTGEFVNNETEIVNNLGLALFSALDYGLSSDEEQLLSEDLDLLISSMTGQLSCNEDDDVDEGYADTKFNDVTIDSVVALCEKHLPSSIDPGTHYSAVCRALIHEALELKIFLSKISSANESLQKLSGSSSDKDKNPNDETAKLNFTDWAHMWIQVMEQLRKGITNLRRVERIPRISLEYELTPYEILMEDIRFKRYTLKKVTSSDHLSRLVKRNAHDVILDFIRSRPSLSPAHERVLGPVPPRSKSLHEQLIEQIQEQNVQLKPVESTQPAVLKRSTSDFSNVASSQRRRLKPSLIEDDIESLHSNQSVSDIEDLELYVSDNEFSSLQLNSTSLRSSDTSGVSSSSSQPVPFWVRRENGVQEKRRLPLELLPSPRTPEELPLRRNSFFGTFFSSFRNPRGIPRAQSSYIESFQTQESNEELKGHVVPDGNLTSTPLAPFKLKRSYSDRRYNLNNKKKPQDNILRLTFDEVIHIRQVLTRAKLEKYQSSVDLYNALKSGKVCFCCRAKKFNIFVWPYTCQICQRKVCGKCLKKSRFPTGSSTEKLVFSLSPSLTPMVLDKSYFLRNNHRKTPIEVVPGISDNSKSSSDKKIDLCLDCHVVLNVVTDV